MQPKKYLSEYYKLKRKKREKFIVSKPWSVVETSNNVIELGDTNKNDQPSNI